MSVVSANDATKTHYCKQPGCENEARSPVGRYAYCTDHQGIARATRVASTNGAATSTGTAAALRDLMSLAKRVDSARAKAQKARKAANRLDAEADTLEGTYRDALAQAVRQAA